MATIDDPSSAVPRKSTLASLLSLEVGCGFSLTFSFTITRAAASARNGACRMNNLEIWLEIPFGSQKNRDSPSPSDSIAQPTTQRTSKTASKCHGDVHVSPPSSDLALGHDICDDNGADGHDSCTTHSTDCASKNHHPHMGSEATICGQIWSSAIGSGVSLPHYTAHCE